MMLSNKISAVILAFGLMANRCQADHDPFNAGPLSIPRLNAAAEAAGFKVIENKSHIPTAAYSRIPFDASDYDDKRLAVLREKYRLEKVIAPAREEWTAQLLLNDWVHGQIATVDWINGNGEVTSKAAHALDILEESARANASTARTMPSPLRSAPWPSAGKPATSASTACTAQTAEARITG
jgi:hypothetical protein